MQNLFVSPPFDLHMHTTASDGEYTPIDLVRKAHSVGLKTIAITDHDTLDAVEEAQIEGERLGIEVIAGVELSTKHKGKSVDVLGYYITNRKELDTLLQKMRDERENRTHRIIDKFVEIGMPLTIDDVKEFGGGSVLARPHIAKAIVKKGYVSDYQTVFDEYLADGKPCALDKFILSPQQAIDLIHNAGGKAFIAHPKLIGNDELVAELLNECSFDGIEVWHRKHDLEDASRYEEMAKSSGILMSGGSDFHNDEHELGRFGFNLNKELHT
ncbi:PHP domain-containing protein [Ferviditalea candida]|uniref:PHP domain-containing protein n=1 Tax=Ferviditalea candida TaxID=3108399 RepID=A0ABU5ZML8_9BACL|nr:PHP domain-containing protein [Paenibacillaceae bacterium T2]